MWKLSNSDMYLLWRDVVYRLGLAGLERIEEMLVEMTHDAPADRSIDGAQRVKNIWLPGLPTKRWFERSEFSWVSAVENKFDDIYREFLRTHRQTSRFSSYLGHSEQSSRYRHNSSLVPPEEGWLAYIFCRAGIWNQVAWKSHPVTAAAIAAVPIALGDVMLSRLVPGSAIPPHNGLDNFRLTAHLGLEIPKSCGIRVDDEVRHWEEGRCLIFDDTFLHGAWNFDTTNRTVLLFDFWHPGISHVERRALEILLPELRRRNEAPRGTRK